MSLTYGYDLKDGDKMLEAPVQVAKITTPLFLPGAVLVNNLPICEFFNVVLPRWGSRYLQCDTFLHGSHTSATNHWRK